MVEHITLLPLGGAIEVVARQPDPHGSICSSLQLFLK